MTTLFSNPDLRLVIVGGKGGVGKTTFSSALGISLAETFKTLVVSTDPAHSLSDSFEQPIGDRIAPIDGVKNLFAFELNAERAFREFMNTHDADLRRILDSSTYLDQSDIDMFMQLAMPGMDEVMGLKTVADLVEQNHYDKYIIDTAPTGHALRLLSMPDLLDAWVKVLAQLRWKYRKVVETFSGSYSPDSGDDLLLSLKKTVKRIEALLKDATRCEFLPIMIPTQMALAETERLVNSLWKYGVSVKRLAVNNVLTASGADAVFIEKRREQQTYLKQISAAFPTLEKLQIPMQASEVKGVQKLRAFMATVEPI
jgi:arsenite-transporting ATPase